MHYRIHDGFFDKLRISISRLLGKVVLLEKRECRKVLWLTIDFDKSQEEIFSTLRKTYLGWRHEVGAAARHCEIVGQAAQKSSEGEIKLRRLCERWNADTELTSLPERHLIFIIEAGVWPWMGFISAVEPGFRSSQSSTMRLFDYKEEHAGEMAALNKWLTATSREDLRDSELEKPMRKAEHVRNPIQVPKGIHRELAAYLRLEFGESWWHPRSLKAHHLKFAGEYVIDGVPTQYWSFPTSAVPSWATVQRFDDEYCLGMTSDPPPESRNT